MFICRIIQHEEYFYSGDLHALAHRLKFVFLICCCCCFRQKQQLHQLEQRLRESELQIHGALMGRGAPLTEVCLLRLQVSDTSLSPAERFFQVYLFVPLSLNIDINHVTMMDWTP